MSATFVVLGLLIAVANHDNMGWLVVAFFAIGVAVAGWQILNPSTLVITSTTIEVTSLGRRRTKDLMSCGIFEVWRNPVGRQTIVVFDHPDDERKRSARMNRALCGHSGSLPETFGMNAHELAALLNRARDAAREGSDGSRACRDD